MKRRIFSTLMALFVLSPFVPLFLWSISGRWFFPQIVPSMFSVRAWDYLFGTAGSQMLPALRESLLLSVEVAGIATLFGIPAGRALGLYQFKGKGPVAILLLIPILVPGLSTAMGLHLWFLKIGLAETRIGVVLIHLVSALPYAVFVLWGVFSNFDPEFEEQARSLGAGRLATFCSVTLPAIRGGVLAAFLFGFLLSWSQYLATLIIGGGRILTLPILLFSLMGSGDRPVAAAASLVFVAPALVVLLVSARNITGSLRPS